MNKMREVGTDFPASRSGLSGVPSPYTTKV